MRLNIAQTGLSRRRFCLLGTSAAVAAVAACRRAPAATAAVSTEPPGDVSIAEFANTGERGNTVTVAKVVKSDADWRAQLSPLAYSVTRHENTEAPFTSPLLEQHAKGLFRCICCDTALFSSDTKFDSGTGWPSFWQPIAKENIVETSDTSLFMARTAVSCRRCDAHQGHVFDDGPKPTGLRYCINGVALRFAKA